VRSLKLSFVGFVEGERVPILSDESGLPIWYSTLFATTQVRNAGKALNTTFAAPSAIRGLLQWADRQGIILEERFAAKQFLNEREVESLRVHAQSRSGSCGVAVSNVRRMGSDEGARAALKGPERRVSSGTQYSRMTYMAEYLKWLANRMVEGDVRRIQLSIAPGR
jgi:hypothetical protein